MPSLYSTTTPPTWTVPRPLLQRQPAAAPPSRIGYLFDPNTGDLAIDGGGHVQYASAEIQAVQAAAFLLTIQQGAHPVFSRGFGIDLEGCLEQDEPQPNTERRIVEAMRAGILQDARLRDVTDVVFEWGSDREVSATYTLVLANGASYRQRRKLVSP